MHVKHEHDTVSNMVKRLAEEAQATGHNDFESYFNRQDYVAAEGNVVDAEVIEEPE